MIGFREMTVVYGDKTLTQRKFLFNTTDPQKINAWIIDMVDKLYPLSIEDDGEVTARPIMPDSDKAVMGVFKLVRPGKDTLYINFFYTPWFWFNKDRGLRW